MTCAHTKGNGKKIIALVSLTFDQMSRISKKSPENHDVRRQKRSWKKIIALTTRTYSPTSDEHDRIEMECPKTVLLKIVRLSNRDFKLFRPLTTISFFLPVHYKISQLQTNPSSSRAQNK
jgi:hypothetical protein